MAKVNTKPVVEKTTNEVGTVVNKISFKRELERSVLACLLWEDQFYQTGSQTAKAIKELVHKVSLEDVADLAIKTRTKGKLRHVPLFLVREMARHPEIKHNPKIVADTLEAVVQRPDELTEFLAIYWKDGKQPLSAQVKKGLAKAFNKFNEYSFAKFQGNGAVKLRDVLFLTHAKPKTVSGVLNPTPTRDEILFKKIAEETLETPDTWETNLSAGANKKETFERLMEENKLGALAFLRNLRGMLESKVSESKIREYAKTLKVDRVLPFRFMSAAKYAPGLEDMLEDLMFRCLDTMPKLKGRTVLVIDTSGSMGARVSQKSEITRYQAAAALAVLAREVCEDVVLYATAGNDGQRKHATMKLTPRRGFALNDLVMTGSGEGNGEIQRKIGGGGIFLEQCMNYIDEQEKGNQIDRVIVFTDEQDCSGTRNPAAAKLLGKTNYIANVGSYQNGINSNRWHTVTGFSESLLDYIAAVEEIDSAN